MLVFFVAMAALVTVSGLGLFLVWRRVPEPPFVRVMPPPLPAPVRAVMCSEVWEDEEDDCLLAAALAADEEDEEDEEDEDLW